MMALRYGVAPDYFDGWWFTWVNEELSYLGKLGEYSQPLTDTAMREIVGEIIEFIVGAKNG
ncbi:MAG: hypothetical protein KAU31_04125 [Spirochaetaceae bacterium]|nr:hypothetical protein [Spirochaetaceae bacterium]